MFILKFSILALRGVGETGCFCEMTAFLFGHGIVTRTWGNSPKFRESITFLKKQLFMCAPGSEWLTGLFDLFVSKGIIPSKWT